MDFRRTKIIATLGPSTTTEKVMKNLILAGMDAVRVNFSHGTHESHVIMIDNFKSVRDSMNIPITLILDTKGPEIRIKSFKEDRVFLKHGNRFILTTEDIEGTEGIVSITYKTLQRDLFIGARILIDDGLIELKVVNITKKDIECEIINSGYLSANKSINIPDIYLNLPFLTDKDKNDIIFGIERGFDYIAASFVRSAKDILDIKELLNSNNGKHIKIIAKIENRDGVNNIDEILEVTDGIMVARGDLGVEIPLEEVPLVQKSLIRKSNNTGKLVIIATQMLESMINNPRPTRAETNDVANAIFDGADAIMLSGETAKGDYPVDSVSVMGKIAKKIENSICYNSIDMKNNDAYPCSIINAISYATCITAYNLNADSIVAVTEAGSTARSISSYRPSKPILAITGNKITWSQLKLNWGCIPWLVPNIVNNDQVFSLAVDEAVKSGLLKEKDVIVIVAGLPVGGANTTNTLKVQIVGNIT